MYYNILPTRVSRWSMRGGSEELCDLHYVFEYDIISRSFEEFVPARTYGGVRRVPLVLIFLVFLFLFFWSALLGYNNNMFLLNYSKRMVDHMFTGLCWINRRAKYTERPSKEGGGRQWVTLGMDTPPPPSTPPPPPPPIDRSTRQTHAKY